MESMTMNLRTREAFRHAQITMPTLASVGAGFKGSTVPAFALGGGYVVDRHRAGAAGEVRVPVTPFIDTFDHDVSRSAPKRRPV